MSALEGAVTTEIERIDAAIATQDYDTSVKISILHWYIK